MASLQHLAASGIKVGFVAVGVTDSTIHDLRIKCTTSHDGAGATAEESRRADTCELFSGASGKVGRWIPGITTGNGPPHCSMLAFAHAWCGPKYRLFSIRGIHGCIWCLVAGRLCRPWPD